MSHYAWDYRANGLAVPRTSRCKRVGDGPATRASGSPQANRAGSCERATDELRRKRHSTSSRGRERATPEVANALRTRAAGTPRMSCAGGLRRAVTGTPRRHAKAGRRLRRALAEPGERAGESRRAQGPRRARRAATPKGADGRAGAVPRRARLTGRRAGGADAGPSRGNGRAARRRAMAERRPSHAAHAGGRPRPRTGVGAGGRRRRGRVEAEPRRGETTPRPGPGMPGTPGTPGVAPTPAAHEGEGRDEGGGGDGAYRGAGSNERMRRRRFRATGTMGREERGVVGVGDEQETTARLTGGPHAQRRRRLGNCPARAQAKGAGEPLGGWAARQPSGPRRGGFRGPGKGERLGRRRRAGLKTREKGGGRKRPGWAADAWPAHDRKRGEGEEGLGWAAAPTSRPTRGEGARGPREKGGRVPDGPQEGNAGPRERGEKKKGKRKGFFPF
jgi:hypothetical protein